MPDEVTVSVTIIGGGLVGLSAALFLRHHGVETMLVERHAGTSPQPKARRINQRTMELYREIGIDQAVTDAGADLAGFQRMAAGRTLSTARHLPMTMPGGLPDFDLLSPAGSPLCTQDSLEPLLLSLARGRGARCRYGTEAVDVRQDRDGVTTVARDASGAEIRLRSAYLIAADGAHSPIRERLGIRRRGRGALQRSVNVYFRADLTDVVRHCPFNLCQIEHPDVRGAVASLNGTDRWLFSCASEAPAISGFALDDHDAWAGLMRTVTGVADLDVRVLSVQEWQSGMHVAERFADGRIFLAGDSAHVMPPFAAAGANTGIQDAHNLAWKLAFVLRGEAGPAILDSYDAERRPVGYFVADQSSIRTGNLRDLATRREGTDGTPLAHPLVLILGHQYSDGMVIDDGTPPAPTVELELSGRPGTRLPHVWLERNGVRCSSLDLAQIPLASAEDTRRRGFVLLTGGRGQSWLSAAESLARLGCPLTAHSIDVGEAVGERWHDPAGRWPAVAGIDAGGAVLVRPDGFVAWRHRHTPTDAESELRDALSTLLAPAEVVVP